MSDNTDQDSKRPLSLGRGGGRLELRKPIETGSVRQSFPHGRSKTVQVEVRKKRLVPAPGALEKPEAPAAKEAAGSPAATAAPVKRGLVLQGLTAEEKAHRTRALKGAIRADEEARRQAEEEARRKAEEEARRKQDEEARRLDEDARRKAEKAEEESRREVAERAGKAAAAKVAALTAAGKVKPEEEPEEEAPARRGLRVEAKKVPAPVKRDEPRRRTGKLTITKVLNEGDDER